MLSAWRAMNRTKRLALHLCSSERGLSVNTTRAKEKPEKYNGTKAVIFDMGGVILASPLHHFREFEKQLGLPAHSISRTVLGSGDNGAWARLERGEFTAPEFAKHFSEECSRIVGRDVDLSDLLPSFANFRGKENVLIHDVIIDAIQCIKAEGVKLALLTNNWKWQDNLDTQFPFDSSLFDVIVESCRVGMRKPEDKIYELTLDKLQVDPQNCVFLDDLGMNLKPAKQLGMKTIKVSNPDQAVTDLEELMGIDLRGYMEGTIAVPERLKIDKKKLRSYLNWALKLHDKGDDDRVMPVVRCFEHGQSNPTYFVKYANKNMVLRKKPPGKLLPSAHAVEREYRIMKALSTQGVPVPKMLGLCEESSLLGTPFYIMDHVPGRVFKDPLLPGFTPAERKQVYQAMVDVLAKIHKVNITDAELQDYGKQGNYVKRNFERWARQYQASLTEDIPAMNELMKWLSDRMPTNEKVTVVHGDFRLDNLIFHPTKLEVVAVLDWELSTLGDPITDLATNCMPYYFPEGISTVPGVGSVDLASLGIPEAQEYVQQYSQLVDLPGIHNWDLYVSFICFRFAAILQGVYKRALQGIISLQGARDLEGLGIPIKEEYIDEYSRRMQMVNVPNFDFYVTFTFFRGCSVMQGVYKRALQGGLRKNRFTAQTAKKLGIPSVDEILTRYERHMGYSGRNNWQFYTAFAHFKNAAILQGVYKRYLLGQASSSTAQGAGLLAQAIAQIGWDIARNSDIPANPSSPTSQPSNPPSHSSTATQGNRSYSTKAGSENMSANYTTGQDRDIPGSLPLSASNLSPRAYDLYKRVKAFIKEHVAPAEPILIKYHMDPQTMWSIHPLLEELKQKAKAQGLWNLFLPKDSDPDGTQGAGLTNVEYAYMCEEMGKYPLSSEVFNCSAPDTGNMETLVRYANDEMKEKYLKPLLNGEIRSCFGMTEPHVASSDATNIQASIKRDGDHYIINGRKWWTSGAMDPRCKVCIFMGKTNPGGPVHKQQSMILVPMDSPGVQIIRPLTVFGYLDAPHGHAEMLFENVRVPASHLLLGEGRGFEIAQGRLGPGRIHHCMRLVGNAEMALSLMVDRVQNRVAFGKPLVAMTNIQQDIAKSRIEIEQCRLLVLKAAHMMDTVGNKVAAPEIAMIKVAAPNMVQTVVDRAIQSFGGMGVCQDTVLPPLYAWARILRIADGPDEVHLRAISKMEVRTQNLAKL